MKNHPFAHTTDPAANLVAHRANIVADPTAAARARTLDPAAQQVVNS